VDCSQAVAGDGSKEHPWNALDQLSAHLFQPGEVAAIKRRTSCEGTLQLRGSGSAEALVRLTAYGEGPRPRLIAGSHVTQAVLLKNAEYWEIDSLDISGGNTYGLLVTGDQDKVLSHITLRNLVVHDVQGGELKNKDNGMVVFLRGSKGQRFDHVLVENVVAAHTNQWAGIMMGAGNFYSEEDGYNRDVVIRNSVAHDMYGDGIILFRVRNGLIDSSAAWLTGQQPTESVGTPNAIWTWSCTDCAVRNNESFLTESPGVDGGAYDIDWATTRNTVENNYAHDTQGYCMAAFAAGYVTHAAVLRGNVCVDNGLSPRMARLQGAIYIHTWNGGSIDGLTIENNTIDWNPPAPSAVIVNDEGTEIAGCAAVVRDNVIHSTSPLLIRSIGNKLAFENNRYVYDGLGTPTWIWNGATYHSLPAMQAAGGEKASTLQMQPVWQRGRTDGRSGSKANFKDRMLDKLVGLDGRMMQAEQAPGYRLVTTLELQLDTDGLIAPEAMARLSVLRTLAREYNSHQLQIVVLVPGTDAGLALRNALLDLDTPSIRFARFPAGTHNVPAGLRSSLIDSEGAVVASWPSAADFNAATIGYAVRLELGVPVYAQMDARP
jgi:outer membrane protein assembly factor BamB